MSHTSTLYVDVLDRCDSFSVDTPEGNVPPSERDYKRRVSYNFYPKKKISAKLGKYDLNPIFQANIDYSKLIDQARPFYPSKGSYACLKPNEEIK